MREAINNLANIIKNGKNVALYAATPEASQIIYVLKKEYNVAPCCVIDSDIYKQGKKFQDLEILSLNEAVDNWINLQIYCASPLLNSCIIGFLLERGIPEDSIINYEPVEQRNSCLNLENNCSLIGHSLRFCCELDSFPSVANNGNYIAMIKEMSLLREKVVCDLQEGKETPCDHCQHLKNEYYYKNKKTRLVIIGDNNQCNFNCKYCSIIHLKVRDIPGNAIDSKAFMRNLSEFEETMNFAICVSSGEITIQPEREIVFSLLENCSTKILTNASVYDHDIAKLLNQGLCTLIVSLDAGTRETFADIKGADYFERVIDNLRRYKLAADHSAFVLKYIFLPDINANLNDVEGFTELCRELMPISVVISYDCYASKEIGEDTMGVIKALYLALNNLGIIIQFDFIESKYIDEIRKV